MTVFWTGLKSHLLGLPASTSHVIGPPGQQALPLAQDCLHLLVTGAASETTTAALGIPTALQSGATWVRIGGLQFSTNNRRRLTVFRQQSAGPIAAAPITVTWPIPVVDRISAVLRSDSDVFKDFANDGEGAVLDVVTASGTGALAQLTMPLWSDPDNGLFVAVLTQQTSSHAAGPNLTELYDLFPDTSSSNSMFVGAHEVASLNPQVTREAASPLAWGMIGMQIKAGPPAPVYAFDWNPEVGAAKAIKSVEYWPVTGAMQVLLPADIEFYPGTAGPPPPDPLDVRHPEYEPGAEDGWLRVPVPNAATLVPWPIAIPDNPTLRAERNPVFHDPGLPIAQWKTVTETTVAWGAPPAGYPGPETNVDTTVRRYYDTGVPLDRLERWNPLPMVVASWPINTDNQSTGVLTPRIIASGPTSNVSAADDLAWVETQPLEIAANNSHYLSRSARAINGGVNGVDSAIFGGREGRYGSQGGSAMPGYATIRIHEIRRWATEPIGHALKINVDAYRNLHAAATLPAAFCHPATTADSYYADFGLLAGAGIPVEAKIGCRSVPTSPRPTGSGMGIAAAQWLWDAWWTYGAYVCDSSKGQNGFYIGMEIGPDGDGETVFAQEFGFPFKGRLAQVAAGTQQHAFLTAMVTIYSNLAIVANPSLAADQANVARRAPMSVRVATVAEWRAGLPLPTGAV